MKTGKGLVVGLTVVFAVCLWLSGTFATAAPPAGPDKVSLTDISTTPPGTLRGQNWNVGTVDKGTVIYLNFNVKVTDKKGGTKYPLTMYLTAETNVGSVDVVVTGLNNCYLVNNSTTCENSVELTAPTSVGAYQVRIKAEGGTDDNVNGDFFFVNFTVPEDPPCEPEETTLELEEPPCTLYHDDSVSLSATLKDSTNTALANKTIIFYVDGEPVGTATTNSSGIATLNYDPSGLSVGDHELSAEWQSDDTCYESSDVTGVSLGIEYLFQGFQPPINADGSTVLTGRCGPVKIIILDAHGVPVPDADARVYFEIGTPIIVGSDPENAASSINFDYNNLMRYSDGQYVYNWDLSTVQNGTYTVRVFLGEGTCATAHQVVVSVGKKKK